MAILQPTVLVSARHSYAKLLTRSIETRRPVAGAFVFTLRADTLHATTYGDLVMGKGDKRTKRGKIFRGSYGKTRSHKKGGKSKAAKKPSA